MTKTAKIVVAIVVLVLVVWGFSAYKKQPQATGEPIKIGVIGPFTGSQANYGEGVKEGIELAFSEFENSTINGSKIQLIYEDTAGEVKNAISAAQKLIDIDKVGALVSAGASQEAVALIPVAEQSKVSLIASVSQAPELSDAGDFIFRMMPNIDGLAVKAADLALEKGKRAATITANYNQATLSAEKAFVDEFTKNGGTVVAQEQFQKGTGDFRTNLSNINIKSVDVVFLNGLTIDASLILKQKQEMKFSWAVVGQGAVEDQKVIETAPKGSEGVVFATYNAVPPQKFVDAIKKKYGTEPKRWNIEGYETFKFLVAGLQKAKTFDPPGIQTGLAQVRQISGVTGLLYFDEKGNISRPVFVKIIKDGKFEEIK